MTTGTELYDQLVGETKDVCDALDILNGVITGGAFDRTRVWPTGDLVDDSNDPISATDHSLLIRPYFDTLEVTDGLETSIDKLLQGVPATDTVINGVRDAISKAMDFILKGADKVNDALAVGDRADAIQELNKELTTELHPTSPTFPTGDADPEGTPKYSYIPALMRVFDAAGASAGEDVQKAIAELEKIAEAVEKGEAHVVFGAYAAASLDLFLRTLDTTTNN